MPWIWVMLFWEARMSQRFIPSWRLINRCAFNSKEGARRIEMGKARHMPRYAWQAVGCARKTCAAVGRGTAKRAGVDYHRVHASVRSDSENGAVRWLCCVVKVLVPRGTHLAMVTQSATILERHLLLAGEPPPLHSAEYHKLATVLSKRKALAKEVIHSVRL